MMAVYPSEGFAPYMQQLENSSWSQYYMYFVRKTILNGNNYHLDGASSKFMMHLTGINLQILKPRMALLGYPPVFFGG